MLPTFGKSPSGKEKKLVQQSPNYFDGEFKNTMPTTMVSKGHSMAKLSVQFLNKPEDCYPPNPLPFIETDLFNLPYKEPVVVWLGHSTYFIRIADKTILVDPVLTNYAAPFSWMNKAFPGSDNYRPGNFPAIDVLLITHDHYDHLDYETVGALKPKVKQACTSYGVSSHLTGWGYASANITELDWYQSAHFAGDIQIMALPARHFSGRLIKRNQTLWSSFVIEYKGYKLYVGGDSGYGSHFKQIGETCGPFDMAMLECGQYNLAWHDIHMLPEETVQAAIDLGTKTLLPVHWGKFCISLHAWDDPIKRVTEAAARQAVHITTPLIGEPVIIGSHYPDAKWWLDV